jgi:hypothetical protein
MIAILIQPILYLPIAASNIQYLFVLIFPKHSPHNLLDILILFQPIKTLSFSFGVTLLPVCEGTVLVALEFGGGWRLLGVLRVRH